MQATLFYITGVIILCLIISFLLGFMRIRSTFTLIDNGVSRGFSSREASPIWAFTAILLWFIIAITFFVLGTHHAGWFAGTMTIPTISLLIAVFLKKSFSHGSLAAEYAIEEDRDFLRYGHR